jgi:hypothetical protein
VREWKPPEAIRNFVSSQEANQQKGPVKEDLISGDLRKTVDHPYLFSACQYEASDDIDMNGNYTKPNKHWERLSDKEILETYAGPGDSYVYAGEGGYVDHEELSHWPCSVLKEEAGTGRYTVRIHQSPLRGVVPDKTAWHENGVPRILTNYSRESIHYFVKPSAIDQLLPNVFRHAIGAPKHLYPKHWKNLEDSIF